MTDRQADRVLGLVYVNQSKVMQILWKQKLEEKKVGPVKANYGIEGEAMRTFDPNAVPGGWCKLQLELSSFQQPASFCRSIRAPMGFMTAALLMWLHSPFGCICTIPGGNSGRKTASSLCWTVFLIKTSIKPWRFLFLSVLGVFLFF